MVTKTKPKATLTMQGKIIGEMIRDGEIEHTTGDNWYVPYLTDKSVYAENVVDYSITDAQKLANKMDKMFSNKDSDDETDDIDVSSIGIESYSEEE